MGYPHKDWAMVKLTPRPAGGSVRGGARNVPAGQGDLGLRGATNLRLAAADVRTARSALAMARKNVTQKKRKP